MKVLNIVVAAQSDSGKLLCIRLTPALIDAAQERLFRGDIDATTTEILEDACAHAEAVCIPKEESALCATCHEPLVWGGPKDGRAGGWGYHCQCTGAPETSP